jgi:hypothetical protein
LGHGVDVCAQSAGTPSGLSPSAAFGLRNENFIVTRLRSSSAPSDLRPRPPNTEAFTDVVFGKDLVFLGNRFPDARETRLPSRRDGLRIAFVVYQEHDSGGQGIFVHS